MTDLRGVLVSVLVVLALPAHANPVVGSETVVQARHDLFGKRMVPLWEYIHFESAGVVDIEGYAGLEWRAGVDHPPEPQLFVLSVRGDAGNGEWAVGRLQATTLRRRQTLDGARYTFGDREKLQIDAWGGYARHHDIDDFIDGAWMGRVSATRGGTGWVARAGLQLDVDQGEPLLRQDAETQVEIGGGSRPLVLHGLIGVAEPDFTAEWARVELRGRAISALQTGFYVQHREAPDPDATLGDAILHDLANGGVDQAGIELRWFGVGWAQLHVAYRLSSYNRSVDAQWGHGIDVKYLSPPEDEIRLVPAYSFRAGPAGMYHAAYAVVRWSVTDDIGLEGRVALVPYRRGGDPWALAVNAGTTYSQRFNRQLSLRVVGEAASDSIYKADLRIAGALDVRFP